MPDEGIAIRAFRDDDLDTIVALSLRAWAPVFASVRTVLGDAIFLRLHPDWEQRRGVGMLLAERAVGHMRERGIDIAVVETGGDPGHAPARAAYEAAGFTLLPIARCFRLLD